MRPSMAIHRGSENIFKRSKFREMRETYNVDPAQANTEAQNWWFDYQHVAPWVERLRTEWYGKPFITWQWKATPRLIEATLKHPLKVLKYPLGFAYATKMFLDKYDFTQEDYDKYLETLNDRFKRKGQYLLLPYKDENNELRVVDLTWIAPWGWAFEIGGGLKWALEHKDIGQFTHHLIREFGNPFFTALADMGRGIKSYNQQPITRKTKAVKDQIGDYMNYLYNHFYFSYAPEIPGLMDGGFDYERWKQVLTDKKDRVMGLMRDWRFELLSEVGIQTYPISEERTREHEKIGKYVDAKDIRKEMRRVEKDYRLGNISKQERDKEATRLLMDAYSVRNR